MGFKDRINESIALFLKKVLREKLFQKCQEKKYKAFSLTKIWILKSF